VLFQAIEPPIINGVKKPMKPGGMTGMISRDLLLDADARVGYQDSGADIAYVLRSDPDIEVLTPTSNPDPREATGWCFPDTEEGILFALEKGATHLWANTILFEAHPLQRSPRVGEYQDNVRTIGQPPLMVQKYDDKEFVNHLLRSKHTFSLPRGWSISESSDIQQELLDLNLPFPIVAKPIRGRGSHGEKVCQTLQELVHHVESLLKESPSIMMEEFLAGQEATITVMPPSNERPEYWSLPIVTRFSHVDGIVPYNGVVAVTSNSRVVSQKELDNDIAYQEAAHQCEEVARILRTTAPIRIDIRRRANKPGSEFALFDVNMKPVR
jgi:hypothetical protein